MSYYAVVALIEVSDDLTHEQVYDVVDNQFPDGGGLRVVYRDIDPEWRAFRVLDENAEIL